MKFEATLFAQTIEDWRPHYINYTHLKAVIKRLQESLNNENAQHFGTPKLRPSRGKSSKSLNIFDAFIVELDKQFVPCNTFYEYKESLCGKRLAHLQKRCQDFFTKEKNNLQVNSSFNEELVNSWISTFSTFSSELHELKQFAELNLIGFQKITKKFDKKMSPHSDSSGYKKLVPLYFHGKVELSTFANQKNLKAMEIEVQNELETLQNLKMKSSMKTLISPEETPMNSILEAYNNQNTKLLEDLIKVSKDVHFLQLMMKKAVSEGKLEIVKVLKNQGVSLSFKNEMEQSLLHISHPDCLEFLLSLHQIEVELEDSCGQRAVHVFAKNGIPRALSILLNHKVLIDPLDQTESTPLLLASRGEGSDFSECVSLLLEKGANPNAKNRNGKTPIHFGAFSGNVESLQFLLKTKGIEVDMVDGKTQTALHIASKHGHVSCCEILVNHGARIDIRDNEGYTPLHHSARKGNLKILQILIGSVKDLKEQIRIVNIQDVEGTTALHLSAEEDFMDCSKLLLDYKANADIKDMYGYTPDVYAAYVGDLNLANLLSGNHRNEALQAAISNLTNRSADQKKKELSNDSSPSNGNNSNNGLLCKVRFQIRAQTKTGQFVAIVGNRKILGTWDHNYAFPMTLEKNEGGNESEGSIWTAEIRLPYGAKSEYRYVICEGSFLVKWEALPSHREVKPEFDDEIVDDGTFGINSKISSSKMFV